MLWAAFPPLGWSALAWIAPIPWLILAADERLSPRRPYLLLWLIGFAHWLVLLQGVRLAHWATYFGWIALAAYLAIYLPLFIGLTRIAVHQMQAPLILAAPLIWVGLEYARGYIATGFSIALLGHTQVHWTTLIQISDLVGAYGVSLVIMFAAACLTTSLRNWSKAADVDGKNISWPLAPFVFVLAVTLIYGRMRSQGASENANPRVLKAAMVQAWVDTIFEYDPERDVQTFQTYAQLTRDAYAANPQVDVIVWPESMFTEIRPLVTRDDKIAPPPGEDWPNDVIKYIDAAASEFHDRTRRLSAELDHRPALLVGVSARHYGNGRVEQYNSAAHVAPEGQVVGRYDKMHRVMFGEYVPLGELVPWIYRLTPLSSGLSKGKQPESFEIGEIRLAPNICFESTVPHLIRRQIMDLRRRGEEPHVLVNHTNDGWFWGSSILDLHLACSVFRAVENRKPVLVAANTGLSAWIDGDGRLRAVGPRFKQAVVTAEVKTDHRTSVYTWLGDWLAGMCLAFSGIVAGVGIAASFGNWRRAVAKSGDLANATVTN